ncbi:UDP-N-acetylglucosamine transferase subunit [Stygiomarasmius scandens]|uniref:UDP-N-acetylglucosamine transferase subunit ALG14 n=1 Tax=Marasmiellus scandens TaxID=2682957 RepID=A0ABR1JWZ0_9AGAR
MLRVLLVVSVLIIVFTLRIWSILPRNSTTVSPWINRNSKTRKLAVFLGSGGHTSEALALLSALDFERYSPRIYIVGEGDHLSAQKAVALENAKSTSSQSPPSYTIMTIPRARKVHQSILTTPVTAFVSLLKCIHYVSIQPLLSSNFKFADVLLLNGPGTCFVLCVAVYINKIFGLPCPIMLYVESFARVKKLSLSGKMLRYLVDRFVVQWPQLLNDGKRGECHGWLV